MGYYKEQDEFLREQELEDRWYHQQMDQQYEEHCRWMDKLDELVHGQPGWVQVSISSKMRALSSGAIEAWLDENCSKGYLIGWSQDDYIFESAKDAALFSLRWA